MQTDEVLERYRTGTADERLSLFLGFRDLRGEFAGIEEEFRLDRGVPVRHGSSKLSGLLRRLLAVLRGRRRTRDLTAGAGR